MSKKAATRAFTLVETVIALMVTAILASIVMGVAVSASKTDRSTADKLFAGNLTTNALEVFKFTAAASTPDAFKTDFVVNLKRVLPLDDETAFSNDTLSLYVTSDYGFSKEVRSAYLVVVIDYAYNLDDKEFSLAISITDKSGKSIAAIPSYRIVANG